MRRRVAVHLAVITVLALVAAATAQPSVGAASSSTASGHRDATSAALHAPDTRDARGAPDARGGPDGSGAAQVGAVVGSGVREHIAARGSDGAPVVVFLHTKSDPVAAADSGVADGVATHHNAPAALQGRDGSYAGSASVRHRAAAARAAQDDVLSALPARHVTVRYRAETLPVFTLDVHSSAALDVLVAHPAVRRVDVDTSGTGGLGEVVPTIGADSAHTAGVTGAGVRVAILDTGIDATHPDLASAVVHEECFGYDGGSSLIGFCPDGTERQSGPGSAADDAGHGTHVSGIVTSDGVVAPVGVAPDAEVVAIKVMNNCTFAGCFASFVENIVAPLDWIAANNDALGIQLVNASLSTGFTHPGDCDTATASMLAGAAAVESLWDLGVLVVAAAGNTNSDAMGAPACLSRVVGVGASTDADAAASFSNASATTDLFAPGVAVLSDAIGGGTISVSGTSMASPATAGCAALLIERGEAVVPHALVTRLTMSPVTVTKNGHTYPRIICDDSLLSVPAPPAPLTITPGDGTLRVDWNATAGDGGSPLTGFDVTLLPEATSISLGPGVLSHTFTGLTNGPLHRIEVVATNTIGPSAPVSSDPIGATRCDVDVPGAGADVYTDVSSSHLFCVAIEWMAERGITVGFADGSYRPNDVVTRQAVAAFLARYLGIGTFEPPVAPSFSDVPTTHLFYSEIEWAVAGGITTGFTDGTFGATSAATRQAAAAFLYRIAGEPPFTAPTSPSFFDVPTSHLFYTEIEWLAATGIALGFADDSFRPADPVRRGSAAAFLHRFEAAFGPAATPL